MSEIEVKDTVKPNVPTVTTVPMAPTPPPSAPTAGLTEETAQDKVEKAQNPVQYYVKVSFMITYILLLTTATIIFIEAMRTKDPTIRHILNLETCISIIAGYFYSLFLSQIDNYSSKNMPIDWKEISKTRYIDWSITTPFMLLALCAALAKNIGTTVNIKVISLVVMLNYVMLGLGYLGEVDVMNRWSSVVSGFIAFIGMFYVIFINFIKPKFSYANNVIYYLYLGIWAMYGVVFMFDEEYKNILTNILDSIAKCGIGIGLWLYYSKIITV